MGRMMDRRTVVRVGAGERVLRPDTLVAEEPLEIRTAPGGAPRPPLAVTMRSLNIYTGEHGIRT